MDISAEMNDLPTGSLLNKHIIDTSSQSPEGKVCESLIF